MSKYLIVSNVVKSTIVKKRFNEHTKRHGVAYECTTCKKVLRSVKRLKTHMDRHLGKKKGSKCNLCGLAFSSEYIKTHQRRFHNVGPPVMPRKRNVEIFHCKQCRKTYVSKKSFNQHTKSHVFTYECTTCKKMFQSVKSLKIHMDRHLGKKNESKCNLCGLAFSSEYIKRHQKTVHNVGRVKLQCDKCYKQFFKFTLLRVHIEKNCGTNVYQCKFPGCKEAFRSRNLMTKHRMLTHAPETIPTCAICGKKYIYRQSFTFHMATKHGDGEFKPYKCSNCEKSYTARSALMRHMRNHTGVRPYKCSVCDATFTQDVVLINHMRTHSGEKNFQCDVCGMRFGTKYFMLHHAKKHKRGNNKA